MRQPGSGQVEYRFDAELSEAAKEYLGEINGRSHRRADFRCRVCVLVLTRTISLF
jgi:hypothetical protein